MPNEQHRRAPGRCIERKPTSQSVLFAGTFINLSQIALLTGLTLSGLSRIFAGKRVPTIPTARKIATALSMDFDLFVYKLEDHTHSVKPYLRERLKKVS